MSWHKKRQVKRNLTIFFLETTANQENKEVIMFNKHPFQAIGMLGILLCLFYSTGLFAQVDTAWVRRYNGPGNDGDAAYAITLRSDTAYVTGNSYGDGTSDDYATIKYLPNGDTAWVRRYNGPMGDGWDYANAIAVDGTGNVYVTGRSFGSWDISDDYATIKYNSAGVQQWVSRYNGPGNGGDMPYGLTVDGEGNVYVTGASATNPNWPNNFDYATVKYNSAGVQQWVARYTGPGNPEYDDDYAKAIAVDGTGNVYVTGHSCGSDSSDDYATIKYNQPPAVTENEPQNIPDRVFLSRNYPNPFTGFTQINYGVPYKMAVNISIYNSLGQLIKTLVDDTKVPGCYMVNWNGTDNRYRTVPEGVYFMRLTADESIEIEKLIRVR
jgi:hypothetical protein